jgi:recombination protein RecT
MGKDLAARLEKNVENGSQPETLAQRIQKMEDQFALAMPRGMEAKQLVRDALTVVRQTPKLQECDWTTVLGALMTSAQLGLRPNVLGQCYVLPYGRRAQFIVGYQGLIELAHRSGRVLSIVARTVYENDTFELEYHVDKDVMVHRPTLSGDPGKPVLYYARATLTDGGYQMTNPWTHEQMLAHRKKYSKAGSGSPWDTEFEAMAHKTMVRQLAKLLPKTTDLEVALAADESIRIHNPSQPLTPLQDVPTEVDVVEGEVQDTTSANQLRDELLAAKTTAEVHDLMTRGEREGLLDIEVIDFDGDERELRLIAGRRAAEVV